MTETIYLIDLKKTAQIFLYGDISKIKIARTFRLIQNAVDIRIIDGTPLDEVMKAVLRNALPGSTNIQTYSIWKLILLFNFIVVHVLHSEYYFLKTISGLDSWFPLAETQKQKMLLAVASLTEMGCHVLKIHTNIQDLTQVQGMVASLILFYCKNNYYVHKRLL
jgi:hypothetical protein